MFPQFQRIVTLSVMSILVGLFYWIYQRDRQQRARLWMLGWAAIVVHFGGMLLFAFKLIPSRLADWSAYATLIFGAAAFFLSVCRPRTTVSARLVFWIGAVAPALAYWTAMVFEAQNTAFYRGLLVVELAAAAWMILRHTEPSIRTVAGWMATGLLPGLWVFYRAGTHIESGMDYLLFEGFAITGWRYWKYFRRVTPGVLLTSLSFVAWGSCAGRWASTYRATT